MVYTENKQVARELNTAREILSRLEKDWQNFINDNERAIREVNALEGESKRIVIERMQKVVSGTLPNSSPDSIVAGVLNYDATPYGSYTKDESRGWVRKASDTVIGKHSERYEKEMDAFVRTFIKTSHLGLYYFTIKDFRLQTDGAEPAAFTQEHSLTLEPEVKVIGTGTIEKVEKDEVGLEEMKAELMPPYMKALGDGVSKDMGIEYGGITEEFLREHHVQAIRGLMEILNGR